MSAQLFFHQTFIQGLHVPGLVPDGEESDKEDTTKGYGLVEVPTEAKRDLYFQKSTVREYVLARKMNKQVRE